MAAAIAHRGPDDEGFHLRGPIGLASRRLSIIDPEGGHQPIANEDGSVWVVFNGEIYNHQSLRRGLEARGHRFSTRSDTEVIVHLYEEEGESCVEALHGMFAFALWDEREGVLVLARDRLGQKPVFYSESGGAFRFASEVKALLAVSSQGRELDLESLHHYLSLRFVPSPRTMFRGIHKLPPGHYLVLRDGVKRVHRYWQLSFRQKLATSDDELLERLEEQLERSVAEHLLSDVPVGALLSGGMDSSMIVALASRVVSRPLQTFAIGVEQQEFDELPHARRVAEHCGTHHIERRVSADLIHQLPEMIACLDEPSDPIAACMSRAAELAASHVKVVLGGDGGDELFAGFDRYQGVGYIESYQRLPPLLRHKILRPLMALIPESFAYKSLSQKIRWLDRLSDLPDFAERYAEATCFFRFDHQEKRALWGESLWSRVEEIDSARVITEAFNSDHAEDPLDRMLYADFVTRLPEHSLMLGDRMSMSHGLELRSPFLDHQLVELLAAFPSRLKIRRGTLKYALRRLAESRLPRDIVRRPKQGFMFPVAFWFREELFPFLEGFLTQARTVEQGIFQRGSILRLLSEHRAGRVDHHVRLWMLLNVELWVRMYLEGESRESIGEELRRWLTRGPQVSRSASKASPSLSRSGSGGGSAS
jgi:asparagine synthase (glutamine-hydrolysing)